MKSLRHSSANYQTIRGVDRKGNGPSIERLSIPGQGDDEMVAIVSSVKADIVAV